MEEKSYFGDFYPQGEIGFLEEENRDLSLPVFPFSSNHSPASPWDIPHRSLEKIHGEHQSPPCPLKVYSRRKTPNTQPTHAESLELSSESWNSNDEPVQQVQPSNATMTD